MVKDTGKELINLAQKVAILQESVLDENEFNQIIDKLFDVVIAQYQQRARRYERDLHHFEQQYQLDSANFYRRFESGEMGDALDFFEWAGVYELYLAVQDKVKRLELMA